MPHIIRRVRQAGVYFVTSRTWNSRALFTQPEVAQILLDQLLDCRQREFYKLHPFVIMPDHFHVLLTPSETTSLEKALQMIKGGSSHRIKQQLNYASPVWQEGFHDRWIRDESEFQERACLYTIESGNRKTRCGPRRICLLLSVRTLLLGFEPVREEYFRG